MNACSPHDIPTKQDPHTIKMQNPQSTHTQPFASLSTSCETAERKQTHSPSPALLVPALFFLGKGASWIIAFLRQPCTRLHNRFLAEAHQHGRPCRGRLAPRVFPHPLAFASAKQGMQRVMQHQRARIPSRPPGMRLLEREGVSTHPQAWVQSAPVKLACSKLDSDAQKHADEH